MELINFNNCEINKYKLYGGRNGQKICIIYNNEDYMLKFPAISKDIKEDEYSNSCISEYISCKIIKEIGLKVQETILGKYEKYVGEDRIVVACKDFTTKNKKLKQFAELKNSYIDTPMNGYGTELEEIIQTIEEQQIYDPLELKQFFWQMFIVDALLGNFDRHNGNWGFLIDEENKTIEIAPIYDCGSCLYPQLTDEKMKEIINNQDEIDNRVYVFPNSAIKHNDKKINYYQYISSLENEDCNLALSTVFPKINMENINKIIDETPYISETRKDFYKLIIQERYEKILKHSYDKLKNKDGNIL